MILDFDHNFELEEVSKNMCRHIWILLSYGWYSSYSV